MDTPKPLFPVSDKPLVWHHVSASCASLNGKADLREILLIGFYDGKNPEWSKFISNVEAEFKVPVRCFHFSHKSTSDPRRYLQEEGRTGTGGGIVRFRNEIQSGSPDYFFVEHCDVVCSFPLSDLLQSHQGSGKDITILGKRYQVCISFHSDRKQSSIRSSSSIRMHRSSSRISRGVSSISSIIIL